MESVRIRVAAGILRDQAGLILIARRPDGAHAGGFWEFPGGKIGAGESATDGLRRELAEELDVAVETATLFIRYVHRYPEREVELHVFTVERYTGVPRGAEGQAIRWIAAQDLAAANLLPADQRIVQALQERP